MTVAQIMYVRKSCETHFRNFALKMFTKFFKFHTGTVSRTAEMCQN